MIRRTRDPVRKARREGELRMPEFPMALYYLWSTFHRIRHRKGGNGFSMTPIEWPDIDAFLRLTRISMSPWEVSVIERIDDAFLAAPAAAKRATEETDETDGDQEGQETDDD